MDRVTEFCIEALNFRIIVSTSTYQSIEVITFSLHPIRQII